MGTLREVKSKLKRGESAQRARTLAVIDDIPAMALGAAPDVQRNQPMEKVWKTLLADPPIDHADPNRWRAAADVRPSSFPFCQRRYVMERLGLKMPSDFDVKSNFYTEIGKAVHYVAQNAFARTGRLWGFWRCTRPSCELRLAEKNFDRTPGFMPSADDECPSCGCSKFEYIELVIADAKVGLKGHVDGVLVFRKEGFSSVLEIKTSGDEKVKAMRAMTRTELCEMFRSEAPWFGYWHQASTYAALLRMKYPSLPRIRYVDFMIYSRDNPTNVVAFRMEVPDDNSWWAEIRSRILVAQAARDRAVLPRGFARTQADIDVLPTCKWCSHKEVCLKPQGIDFESDALYDETIQTELEQLAIREKEKWEP